MTQGYGKPIPSPQAESDHYWEKAKQGELWLRKCNGCGEAYFYPRDISPCCFSKDTEWVQASGKATLYTYGIVHRAPHSGVRRRRALRDGHRRAGGGPPDGDQHRRRGRPHARQAADRHGPGGHLRGDHRHHRPAEVQARRNRRGPAGPDRATGSVRQSI